MKPRKQPDPNRPTIREEEIAHLSRADRLTYARTHRVIPAENKPPIKLSNAEQLTLARKK